MGRASRKGGASELREHWSETHPDRHLWTEAQRVHAQMQTQEEYEALYGRGQAAEKDVFSSPLFPRISAEDIERLQYGTFTGEEARNFLAEMILSENFALGHLALEKIADDPVLHAFWKSEMRRIRREAALFQNAGVPHWSQTIETDEQIEDMRQTWLRTVVGSWFWQPDQNRFGGWANPEEARERMRHLPYSITAAAIETQSSNELALARNLLELRERDPEAADKIFRDQLLSEIDYFTLRSGDYSFAGRPSNYLLGELWQLAARHTAKNVDPKILDIEGNTTLFASLLPPEESKVFLDSPVVLDTSRAIGDSWDRNKLGIYQEAWALKGHWQYGDEAGNESTMLFAAQRVLASHIVRVYSGLDNVGVAWERDRAVTLCQEQEETAKNVRSPLLGLGGKTVQGPLPLDNLRPLFEQAGRGEQFEDLQKSVRRSLAEGAQIDIESVLDGTALDQSTLTVYDLHEGKSLCDKIVARIKTYQIRNYARSNVSSPF